MAREAARSFTNADGAYARSRVLTAVFYFGLHALCAAGVLVCRPTPALLAMAAGVYLLQMFGITAGYHRYFSHRSYKTSRAFQLVLALLGASATQKGPLWWSAHHRRHHRQADADGDPHSPRDGFYHAHQGWLFDPQNDVTALDEVCDLARYPELEALNRWHMLPPVALAAAGALAAGWAGAVYAYALPTVLCWHATYSVNSVTHKFGSRRFDTPDTSRNNWLAALVTLGEGWHNNHHFYMASARQGFRWFELDIGYLLLRGLRRLGVVWEIREPPAAALRGDAGGARVPEGAGR